MRLARVEHFEAVTLNRAVAGMRSTCDGVKTALDSLAAAKARHAHEGTARTRQELHDRRVNLARWHGLLKARLAALEYLRNTCDLLLSK